MAERNKITPVLRVVCVLCMSCASIRPAFLSDQLTSPQKYTDHSVSAWSLFLLHLFGCLHYQQNKFVWITSSVGLPSAYFEIGQYFFYRTGRYEVHFVCRTHHNAMLLGQIHRNGLAGIPFPTSESRWFVRPREK